MLLPRILLLSKGRNVRVVGLFVALACAFFVVLTTFSPGYRAPLLLEVAGAGAPRTLSLQWDSGGGFNDNEARPLALQPSAQGGVAAQVLLPQRKLVDLRVVDPAGLPLDLTRVRVLETRIRAASEPLDTPIETREIWAAPEGASASQIRIGGPIGETRRSGLLIAYQATAASILAGFAFAFGHGVRQWAASLRSPSFRRSSLLAFALLAVPLLHYLAWSLGQWPGFPTGDTYDQLNERTTLTFSNWNPFIHTVILNALYDIFQSLGTVIVLQAIMSAWLCAFCFYSLWRRGCPTVIVVVFSALFAFSPVIAIYTLQPWRDILFCLGTIFWMMWIFLRALDVRYGAGAAPLGWVSLVILGGMLFTISGIRHNGLIYLAIIPALMLFFSVLRLREVAVVAGTAFALLLAFYGPVSRQLDVHKNTNYEQTKFSVMIQPVSAIILNPFGFKSPTPDADRKAVDGVIDLALLRQHYNPLSVVPVIPHRKDYKPNSEASLAFSEAYGRLLRHNIPVFLAERIHLFASSIGLNTWGFASSLTMTPKPHSVPFIDRTLNFRDMVARPLLPAVTGIQNAVIGSLWRGPGWTDGVLLWFTAIPGLSLLLVMLMAGRWLPVSAGVGLMILAQVGAIAMTSLASDFRYYYFLNLLQFLSIPMMITEWRYRKQAAG